MRCQVRDQAPTIRSMYIASQFMKTKKIAILIFNYWQMLIHVLFTNKRNDSLNRRWFALAINMEPHESINSIMGNIEQPTHAIMRIKLTSCKIRHARTDCYASLACTRFISHNVWLQA